MSKRSTSFNSNWLELDEFKPWLEKGINTKTARCSICRQSFDVSNMGKSAVVSHAKGKKHLKKINSKNSMSTLFFKNSGESKKVNKLHHQQKLLVPTVINHVVKQITLRHCYLSQQLQRQKSYGV